MTNEVGEAPNERPESVRSRRARGVKLFLRDILLIFLAALLISFLIKTFLIRSFYIPSESMESTLIRNDRIIVNQLTPDLVPIKRGDVVVFKDPGGWLDPTIEVAQNPVVAAVDSVLAFVGLSAPDSNDHLIKRVIGLPGDEVICCDDFGRITVNGIALDEDYIKLPAGRRTRLRRRSTSPCRRIRSGCSVTTGTSRPTRPSTTSTSPDTSTCPTPTWWAALC